MKAVITKDLSKHYDDVEALKNLNISIKPGEIYGFFGPNGSGKTTLVRLLNGILRKSSGESEILGMNCGDADIRSRTSTMSENSLMYEDLSILGNLRFYMDLYMIEPAEGNMRIRYFLQKLDLWDRRESKLGSFSTGMKKKIYLARTLLNNPELIFLDEPTSGLDPDSARKVLKIIQKLAKENGTTIFICTHDLKSVESICDSVGFILNGELLISGSKKEIIQKAFPDTSIKITTSSNSYYLDKTEDINPKLKELIESGEIVSDLSIFNPTIEDAYFHYIHGGKTE